MDHAQAGLRIALLAFSVAMSLVGVALISQTACADEDGPLLVIADDPFDNAPKPAAEKADDKKPAVEKPAPEKAAPKEAPPAEPKPATAAEKVKAAAEKAAEDAKKAADGVRVRALPGQIQIRGAAVPMIRRIGGQTPGQAGENDPVFFPADRATMQRLAKAQELLEQKRFGEAVRLLGDILDGPEDFFFQPDRNEPIHRSLKAQAQRLIGQLPPEGRDSYELQYGATAQQKLAAAIAAGDAAALAEISRRFFHTKAGYEATNLLGWHHLDHGRPLAGALCFKRLQGSPVAEQYEPMLSVRMAACWSLAGMPDKANEALGRLSERRQLKIILAGKEVAPPANAGEALAWLAKVVPAHQKNATQGVDQWAMYRGGASRNTVSNGSSPLLNRRWGVPTSDSYGAVDPIIKQLRQAALEQGNVQLPSMHPLAVNDLVFMRSLGRLVAINFATGKRVWFGAEDESVRQILEPGAQFGSVSRPTPTAAGIRIPRNTMALMPSWLSQRLWDDATYGTLSSDGQSVFCIEDLDVGFGGADQRTIVTVGGRKMLQSPGPRSYNRLAAYDIATEGKLKWEAGGPVGEGGEELAGGFFLGPPLPLAGSVYALVETKGEIRLVVLEAATGKLEWSQQLAVLEVGVGQDAARRNSGVSPSYSDGVLVCPTSAGAAVALDLTTRSLLWGYQYSRNDANNQEVARMRIIAPNMPANALAQAGGTRWVDASVTIANGCVLLTPPESNQIHCLNLLDGTLLWQKPREDGLYLGCVHSDKAVIVGRNSLRALKLADGSPAWSEASLPLPGGATPSGRGFFNGQRYHVPLSSAEVAAIDVDTGRVVARSKSRTGTVPGNLICYRGAVISQGVEVIERFDQRDDLWQQIGAKIAESPDDAAALARRGELLLDEGNFGEAVASLRRSFEIAPDPHTRELLVDAMLEGLRVDFAANRSWVDETEKLIDQPQQRGAYLRLVAAGLQNAGEIIPAFEAYLRIAGIVSRGSDLERVDHQLSVRHDRWVQARLKGLLDAANPEQRAAMEKSIQARLDQALVTSGVVELRQFLAYFGSLPVGEGARDQLANRLIEQHALLEAEQLLQRLERSSNPKRAATAVARMAALLVTAGRNDEAAIYYQRLAGQYADVPCAGNQTGKQLVAALDEKSDIRQWLAPSRAWPVGAVERDDAKSQGGVRNGNFALQMAGSLGPFYEYSSIDFDHQAQSLIGKDGYGRERWRIPLRDATQNNNTFFPVNPNMNYGRASGHVVLVSMGYQVLAIDSLGGRGGEPPKVLWRKDLIESVPGVGNVGFQAHVVQVPWAVQRLIPADSLGRPLGNLGPLSPEIACYQRLRSVLAVDPLMGDTLWTRNDLQPGSEMFGDDELLFIVAPNSEEALVVRALDGFEVGRRKVPQAAQRMLTVGRRVVSWTSENDPQGKSHAVVRMTDAWEQKELWRREFDAASKAWVVADEAVGVMSPAGQFDLMAVADGKSLVDQQVTPDAQLNEIYVLRSTEHYILVANHPAPNRNGVNHVPVPGSTGNPLVAGNVHLFDRQTGMRVASIVIDKQGLLLSQPAALPLLTFATHIYDQRNTRSRNVETEIKFLDKRTGRIVHEERLPNPITSVDVSGDPERNQIVMKTPGTGIRLTFTGKPLPEPSAGAKTPGEGEDSNAVKAGRAVLRTLQGLVPGTVPILPLPVAPRAVPAAPPQPVPEAPK